ncbi:MAG: hypothetical protein A2X67_00830 [Ignavibacteria bacterium GWA2_55_11]|nr:MAG: hypothetical protein A2X67_00830 [Ignavibacteria bacterium GWA2_55_11]OGU45651.1 MAG: hypothetical protein A2X68_01015 [Ignavibacteria bacterium GWC2_56_12]OGU66525.1 MAG: hypothetical protein A3C56_00610 [Ignavibacteria bacterium RIFCSPHIGHO2_02_FULL_56_12]OGU69292.1 MAG: hypothetical protein A3H45_09105 [Ignavibacteria bacterium RIFCSPLOWO2_02_FULL_55_14]OGU73842.1 MAG: hypothetical protein A3G43_08440 [Ignavibacteria bacterium RIFCSPLOWO2_12_FULL_56_21]
MDQTLSFLQPDVVAQLATMELRARLVVEGFMTGLHKSPYHGFSVEFTEHRPYMPGDEIKHVDWKAYGKTNRYYIKQFEEETNLKSTIVLDASASMAFSSGGRMSKLRYAAYTAAALSYLMVEQRDAVGLTLFDEAIRLSLPPRATRSHLKQVWKELELAVPGKITRTAAALNSVAESLKRRGLVIILSDLFDDPKSVTTAFKHFRHKGNELVVMHVLDPLERSFAFEADAVFRDLETREEMVTQPWHIRSSYKQAMQEFIDTYQRECREHAIDYVLLDTSTTFDKSLMEYLHLRSRLH